MKSISFTSATILAPLLASPIWAAEPWTIDSEEEWSAATAKQSGLEIVKGAVFPKEKLGLYLLILPLTLK